MRVRAEGKDVLNPRGLASLAEGSEGLLCEKFGECSGSPEKSELRKSTGKRKRAQKINKDKNKKNKFQNLSLKSQGRPRPRPALDLFLTLPGFSLPCAASCRPFDGGAPEPEASISIRSVVGAAAKEPPLRQGEPLAKSRRSEASAARDREEAFCSVLVHRRIPDHSCGCGGQEPRCSGGGDCSLRPVKWPSGQSIAAGDLRAVLHGVQGEFGEEVRRLPSASLGLTPTGAHGGRRRLPGQGLLLVPRPESCHLGKVPPMLRLGVRPVPWQVRQVRPGRVRQLRLCGQHGRY